jgi:signal transduction histidine kinase
MRIGGIRRPVRRVALTAPVDVPVPVPAADRYGPRRVLDVLPGRDTGPVTVGDASGEAAAMAMARTADRRPRRWLAVVPAAVTAGLLVAMALVRETDPAGGVAVALGLGVTAAVGAVVATRRPDHPCGWLLGGLAAVSAAAVAAADHTQGTASAEAGFVTDLVAWLSAWLVAPVLPLGALLLLTFPSGRLPSRRWRAVAVTGVAAATMQGVALAVTPGPLPVAPWMDNPLGVEALGPGAEGIAVVGGTTAAGVLLLAALRLVWSYRHTRGREREQLRTVASVLPITVVGLVVAAVVEGPLNEASFYLAAFGVTAVPVAIGWAVLRHGLFDIELILNRALVYTSLTAVVVSLYVGLVIGLGAVLRQPVELGVSVVATGVVAVLFAPLRTRLQQAIDQLMYGQRADPYAALSGLGRRLEDAATPDQVLPAAAELLGRSLKLDALVVEELVDKRYQPVASWGARRPDDTAEHLDLVHGRELVGRLTVWPRVGEQLAGRDQVLLADLCRPVALAVHAAQVDRELQASRRQLVTTREEERRRLRADLHDGLGPQLAGVTFRLGAARNVLADDPRSAGELLTQAQTQLRASVSQVRSLVDGSAAVVEQLGLAEALREGANALTSPAGVALELDVTPLPALPAAVEVAVYRIAMESLTNAVRHGHPRRCALHLQASPSSRGGESAGYLELTITDDGHGLPATIVPGVGLASMRQRATELGGTWSIDPLPGDGTCVRARIPLR